MNDDADLLAFNFTSIGPAKIDANLNHRTIIVDIDFNLCDCGIDHHEQDATEGSWSYAQTQSVPVRTPGT